MTHRELLELRCLVRLSKAMALAIDHWRGRQPGQSGVTPHNACGGNPEGPGARHA
jgi:hypothetical protein